MSPFTTPENTERPVPTNGLEMAGIENSGVPSHSVHHYQSVIREELLSMTVCPVCGRCADTVLYSVDSETAARALFRGLDEGRIRSAQSMIEAVWAQPACAYRRCDHCTFSFADPFVAATPELYASLYDSGIHYHQWKWEFQRTMDALEELVADGQLADFALIDIGAGDGAFALSVLERVVECGHVVCTEYSEYGSDVIRDRGVTCIRGGLDELNLEAYRRRFDVVCLFQVLEHLDDLEATFSNLTAVSRNGAHMFIGVPNSVQRSHFDESGFHEDMPPVHIGRWTRRSIEIIAARYGWAVLEDETQPETFSSKLHRFVGQLFEASSSVRALGRVRHRQLRRALRLVLVSLLLVPRLPAVVGLRQKSMGSVYWVHLSKRA